MTVSAKDLRFKISMLFDVLSKKESITITYRGKPKAKLIPYDDKSDTGNDRGKDKLFGIWSDVDMDVDTHIRKLRKGRNFDL